jgi:hypothetical protein
MIYHVHTSILQTLTEVNCYNEFNLLHTLQSVYATYRKSTIAAL